MDVAALPEVPHPSIGTLNVGMDQCGMRECVAATAEFVQSLTCSFHFNSGGAPLTYIIYIYLYSSTTAVYSWLNILHDITHIHGCCCVLI